MCMPHCYLLLALACFAQMPPWPLRSQALSFLEYTQNPSADTTPCAGSEVEEVEDDDFEVA